MKDRYFQTKLEKICDRVAQNSTINKMNFILRNERLFILSIPLTVAGWRENSSQVCGMRFNHHTLGISILRPVSTAVQVAIFFYGALSAEGIYLTKHLRIFISTWALCTF